MKKRLTKRSISMLMAVLLTLGTIVTALPAGFFMTTTDASVIYNKDKIDACILPQVAYNDAGFMTNHVYGGNYNLNSNFKAVSKECSGNLNPSVKDGEALDRDKYTKKNHDSQWEAVWKYYPGSKMKDLMAAEQIQLGYHVNLYNDKHKNWGNHRSSRWGKAVIKFSSAETSLCSRETADERDEQPQTVDGTFYVSSSSWFKYWAGNDTCVCNGSCVGSSTIYALDTKAPKISRSYISKTVDGGPVANLNEGFKTTGSGDSNKSVYLVLEFDESIRFAKNETKDLSLILKTYWKDTSQQAEDIKATLVKLDGKKLIFSFKVPETMTRNGKKIPTNVRVQNIEMPSDNNWVSGKRTGVLLNKDGSTYSGYTFEATSDITDMAGNSMDWSGSPKTISNPTFLDNVEAKVETVTLNVDKVTRPDVPREEGAVNPNEGAGSNVFAAVGDTLNFSIIFNDKLSGSETSSFIDGFTATTNIKDESGYVTLKATEVKNLQEGSSGVNSALGEQTKITFESLVITKDMYQEGTAAIKITALNGMGSVKDICGNALTGVSNITLPPADELYIDRLAPQSVMHLEPDDDNVYTPISSNNGKVMTFPINVVDREENSGSKKSGIDGIRGSFKWVCGSNNEKYAYEYFFGNTVAVTSEDNNKWQTIYTTTDADTSDKGRIGTFIQSGTENGAIYLHIRLKDGVDYGASLNAGKLSGSLVLDMMDNAGNKQTDSYALSHMADNTDPALERTQNSISGNAERTQAVVSARIKATDDYGVQAVTYEWTGQNPVTCDLSSVTNRKNFEVPVSGTFDDTGVDADKKKTVTLKVTVTDFAGHSDTKTYDYTLYFGKIENRYSIEVGTASKPAITPTLTMKKPEAIQSVAGGETELFSYVEVEFKDGSRYIHICDSDTEEDVFSSNTWYSVTDKNVDESSGTKLLYSVESTVAGMTAYESMQQKIAQCYGKQDMKITVRTVDTVTNEVSSGKLTIEYENLDSIAIDEYEEVYIARTGTYAANVTKIADNYGQDIKETLNYQGTDAEQTVYSMDGVSFMYTITGAKEDRFAYNFADVDLSQCTVELMKTSDGTKHSAVTGTALETSEDTVCESYDMQAVRNQGITISSGVSETNGQGWYYLRFVITTTDGSKYITYYNDIFLDRYIYSDTSLKSGVYNKKYSKNITYKGTDHKVEYYTAENVSTFGLSAYNVALGVGIAPVPEGYTLEQTIKFEAEAIMPDEAVARKIKFRVYNQADAGYDKHACWFDMEEGENWYEWIYNIKEASKNENGAYVFDESSYLKDGNYYVPLTEGMNVICFEVLNMNGQISRNVLYVDATKETILKEYNKEKTLTKEQWTLSDATLAGNPRATIELHDFYGESVFAYENEIYTYEPGEWEFVMYNKYTYKDSPSDFNDNLVVDVMTAEDVDGISPAVSDVQYQQDGMNFSYKFTVTDNQKLDLDHLIKLNYDYMYAYKLRKANNTLPESTKPDASEESGEESPIPEDVTVDYAVPLAVGNAANEDGIWTDYGTSNFGIYKTQIKANEDATSAEVCLWGTYMYQEDVPQGEECSGEIALDIYDTHGNSEYSGMYFYYENTKPTLEVNGAYNPDIVKQDAGNMYAYDDSTCFDKNGNLLAECAVPLSQIQTYGAGTNTAAVSLVSGESMEAPGGAVTYGLEDGSGEMVPVVDKYRYHFLSSVPMIRNVGQFDMEFTDLFGNKYEQEFDTTKAYEIGSENIRITYSDTKATNSNVTVMANLAPVSGESMAADARITTIAAVSYDENGNRIVGKKGEIDLIDRTAARMIMEDNGEVYIEGFYDGHVVSKIAKVSNIDKKIETVTPVFLYGDGFLEPNFMEGSEDTVDGAVKVVLECEEDIEGTNGDIEYVFPVGSRKGDKHTFEYKDEAGNTASTTVTLPYNVDKTIPPEPDTTAPEFTGIISGLRHSYTALDGIFDKDSDGNVAEVTDANETMASYIARGYKMAFQVVDESKVKLIARKADSQAPTSYDDTGDSIDGLKVVGYTVEITKPAKFDLYFIDQEGNVKALKGFDVKSFDHEVADVEVQYKVMRNEEGIAFVRAYLVADPDEEVVATNADATTFMNEETVSGEGVETTTLVKRYYHDFFENETYEFTYTDIYGNTGHTTAEVKGFDYGAPTELGIEWFGTSRMTGENVSSSVMNESPDTEGLTAVNHDIIAGISYNKAISGVKLYAYDETKENGVGAEVTSVDGVKAEYTGKKVTVTYENNYNQKIVVSAQAKSSGKKVYTVLPAVQCIDKKAPEVTVSQGILSQNKQTMTFTVMTDEETFINNGNTKASSHTYTADKNGEHVIKVMDVAGNTAAYKVDVSEIDDTLMELTFGLQPDGSDMTSDIESLEIKTGDILYVKSSKEAQVVLDEGSLHLMAGDTGSLQLSADAGMHILRAVDASTGKEQTYKVLMLFRDRSAPSIAFDSNVLSFLTGTDKETIDAALRTGITIEDNKDGMIDPSNAIITGIPQQWSKGIHVITYEVSDTEGNKSFATRSVYVYEEGTPNIQVNGKDAIPYGTMIVDSSTIHVKATNLQNGAVLMKYRPGIKTAAQMKYGTTGELLKGSAKNEEQTFVLPKHSGFYTLYVRSQDRKEQITYVYVNLSE